MHVTKEWVLQFLDFLLTTPAFGLTGKAVAQTMDLLLFI
jgi:hypothetical protein